MEGIIAIFIPIVAIVGFFSSIIVWLYLHYSSRYKERMALLEHNREASIFKITTRDNQNALKYGIVAIMVGIGALLGYVLERIGVYGVIAYSSMILLMGGLGLVGYYYLMEKNIKNKIDANTL
jgi:uncharacterized membrane protein YkgB